MKTVAIIPARGGSKGIPGKNIIDFCGKPLIAWSILQACNSSEIDEVYVSSDSDEILMVAQNFGAKVIKRPDDISNDTATTESAVQHALSVIENQVSTILLLQATSPLRKPKDLSSALQQFYSEKWDSMFSGAKLEDFLIWAETPEGVLDSFNYDYRNRGRRQERVPQFVENGSFYIFKPEVLDKGNRLGGRIGIYMMDFWQSFEIDTPQDLSLLKTIFNNKLHDTYSTIS